MSIRHIAFDCDTPGCGSCCKISAPDVESAFQVATTKYGWTTRHGKHFCAPCTPPTCCRCDPAACAADDTGDHCATSGCAYCMNGCPAPDGMTCCKGGTP